MAAPQNSIFGIQAPKFKYSSDADVELDYSEIITDEPEEIRLTHQSIITKKNSYVDFGTHYRLVVKINLFQYADPHVKFEEIWAYKDKEVKLWRRRDGGFFADSTGTAVLFKIISIVPSFMYSPDRSDILTITFESTDLIDISKLLSS